MSPSSFHTFDSPSGKLKPEKRETKPSIPSPISSLLASSILNPQSINTEHSRKNTNTSTNILFIPKLSAEESIPNPKHQASRRVAVKVHALVGLLAVEF
jgi:hypothetical protein